MGIVCEIHFQDFGKRTRKRSRSVCKSLTAAAPELCLNHHVFSCENRKVLPSGSSDRLLGRQRAAGD